jgi:hypothetical protein
MNFDFRMHRDGDLVLADGLDRRVEQNLAERFSATPSASSAAMMSRTETEP